MLTWWYKSPLDALAAFESLASSTGSNAQPVRYAVRQVIAQEHRAETLRLQAESRRVRGGFAAPGIGTTTPSQADQDDKENTGLGRQNGKEKMLIMGKRDFFGRIINEARPASAGKDGQETSTKGKQGKGENQERKVWVSYNEGYSNAVRKPISLREFLDSF